MTTNSRPTQIYAGAGRWVSDDATQHPGGLFRRSSTDDRWQALTRGLPDGPEVRAITVHPRETGVIFVGTQDGPYRTTDGGESWERLDFPDRGAVVWSITFDPTGARTMYLGTAPVAIYRSDDGGDSWKRLPGAASPGHCAMAFPTRVTRLAVDPSHPDDIYAALEVSGVIRSSDAGETWTDLSAPLIDLAERPHLKSRIGSDTDTEGMLDSHAIAVSAAAPGTVFLAVRMGLFRSDDKGTRWEDMEIGRFSPLTYCRDVRVSPHDPRVLLACLSPAARSTDGSLYRSDDVGETWRRFDHGLKAQGTMMSVAQHPRDPSRVSCATRSGQVFGTADGGQSWHEHRLPAEIQDVYVVACA
jgi:photosystem II stability/assembly factor-like uncharacterized protein